MFGINAVTVVFCALWLHWKRNAHAVVLSQRFFLYLVLLGCLVSSSTILTLGMESSKDGPVIGCMLSPWLYSLGFCITFGKRNKRNELDVNMHSWSEQILIIVFITVNVDTRYFIFQAQEDYGSF